MKMYCSLLLIAGSLFFITSCENAATDKTATNTTGDTTAVATFDLGKARAWIESDNAKFMEEAKKGDSNALAAHYGSDAWLMFDKMEPMKGGDIVKGWGGAIRSGMKELKLTTQDLIGNADLLAETGCLKCMAMAIKYSIKESTWSSGNRKMAAGKYIAISVTAIWHGNNT
jgi:ketosteroid isomerase-like protein